MAAMTPDHRTTPWLRTWGSAELQAGEGLGRHLKDFCTSSSAELPSLSR